MAESIELRLLLEHGVTLLVSRWQVLACATTIILRRRATMRLTESPSSGCPCRGQPSDMADLAALFTLATVFGMLVRVAAWAFRLSESPRTVALRACPQRARFAFSPISVTRIHFLAV